ncbi:MAG: glycosyltransferase family 39 protein [Syntrophotaleaceae bacterium]
MKPIFCLKQSDGEQDRLFRRFFWIVFVGSLLTYFWGIWSVPLLTHNEGRRLVVLREMLASHSWLVPTKNGEIYLQKPPLFYWFGGLFATLAHSSAEWVLRFPSALSALLATWLLFFRMKRHIGRWAALLGAVTLVTSYFFTGKARLAELNMLLTLCVFASVLFFFEYAEGAGRKHLYLAYGLLGLGFLTKGPVALLFFLPGILLYGLLQKDLRVLKGLVDWRGWLLFAVIAFPWYLAVQARLQGAPLLSVIQGQVSGKVVETARKGEPFYYYLRDLLGAFAPWMLVFLYRPVRMLKHLAASRPGLFFGLATLTPLIIFSPLRLQALQIHPSHVPRSWPSCLACRLSS